MSEETNPVFIWDIDIRNRNPVGRHYHKIDRVEPSETPGGTECTDYQAVCSESFFEYADHTNPNVCHLGTAAEAIESGLTPCPKCFGDR